MFLYLIRFHMQTKCEALFPGILGTFCMHPKYIFFLYVSYATLFLLIRLVLLLSFSLPLPVILLYRISPLIFPYLCKLHQLIPYILLLYLLFILIYMLCLSFLFKFIFNYSDLFFLCFSFPPFT